MDFFQRTEQPNYLAEGVACVQIVNPCLSTLERARSAVGRRKLGLLCWALNCCMRWWKFVFIVEASTGRASPGFSYLNLFALRCSNQAMSGISSGLRGSCISGNMHMSVKAAVQMLAG
eukprot:1147594-Pelagomonas_calceolata.AAC.1